MGEAGDVGGANGVAEPWLEGVEGGEDGGVTSTAAAGVVGEQTLQTPRTRLTAAHEWTALVAMAGCVLGNGEADACVCGVEAAGVVGGVAGVQGQGGHGEVVQELALATQAVM